MLAFLRGIGKVLPPTSLLLYLLNAYFSALYGSTLVTELLFFLLKINFKYFCDLNLSLIRHRYRKEKEAKYNSDSHQLLTAEMTYFVLI